MSPRQRNFIPPGHQAQHVAISGHTNKRLQQKAKPHTASRALYMPSQIVILLAAQARKWEGTEATIATCTAHHMLACLRKALHT